MRLRTFLVVGSLAALGVAYVSYLNRAAPKESHQPVPFSLAYGVTWKHGEQPRFVRVTDTLTRDQVDRTHKSDGLMSLAAKARQELPDGTPVAEDEFHRQDEGGTSVAAKQ